MSTDHILVAEDNATNQKVAELMLRRIGYEADIAENGKVAIEKLQEAGHKIVLMDAQMPVMTGVEASLWIRENIEPENQPKIFVMSASLVSESQEQWSDVNVDGYIEKPIRIDALKSVLDAAVLDVREANS